MQIRNKQRHIGHVLATEALLNSAEYGEFNLADVASKKGFKFLEENDYDQAAKFLTEAAELGNWDASLKLAELYQNDDNPYFPRNLEKAVKFYNKIFAALPTYLGEEEYNDKYPGRLRYYKSCMEGLAKIADTPVKDQKSADSNTRAIGEACFIIANKNGRYLSQNEINYYKNKTVQLGILGLSEEIVEEPYATALRYTIAHNNIKYMANILKEYFKVKDPLYAAHYHPLITEVFFKIIDHKNLENRIEWMERAAVYFAQQNDVVNKETVFKLLNNTIDNNAAGAIFKIEFYNRFADYHKVGLAIAELIQHLDTAKKNEINISLEAISAQLKLLAESKDVPKKDRHTFKIIQAYAEKNYGKDLLRRPKMLNQFAKQDDFLALTLLARLCMKTNRRQAIIAYTKTLMLAADSKRLEQLGFTEQQMTTFANEARNYLNSWVYDLPKDETEENYRELARWGQTITQDPSIQHLMQGRTKDNKPINTDTVIHAYLINPEFRSGYINAYQVDNKTLKMIQKDVNSGLKNAFGTGLKEVKKGKEEIVSLTSTELTKHRHNLELLALQETHQKLKIFDKYEEKLASAPPFEAPKYAENIGMEQNHEEQIEGVFRILPEIKYSTEVEEPNAEQKLGLQIEGLEPPPPLARSSQAQIQTILQTARKATLLPNEPDAPLDEFEPGAPNQENKQVPAKKSLTPEDLEAQMNALPLPKKTIAKSAEGIPEQPKPEQKSNRRKMLKS